MTALRWHPRTDIPTAEPPDMAAANHVSRLTLERVLADPDDDSGWKELAAYYDAQADTWTGWVDEQPWYLAPVRAGLAHARAAASVLEVSCGTGQATPLLDEFAGRVLATDVNFSMLVEAPRLACTTYAAVDVRRLPIRTGSVHLLVGLNAVPHLTEFARVLAPSGQLLWCTSFGTGTPLYVAPERLAACFGPGWRGEAGQAGHGDWLLLTREG